MLLRFCLLLVGGNFFFLSRWMAVSHPFIHQSMKDRFKLKLICFTTVICSFLLNIVTIPVERELRKCLKVEVKNHKAVLSTSIQLVQKEIMSNLYYAICKSSFYLSEFFFIFKNCNYLKKIPEHRLYLKNSLQVYNVLQILSVIHV